MNFEVKGGSLKVSYKQAKATFMRGADSTISILFEGDESVNINKPGEYEYSSVHFHNIEDKESDFLGKIDVLNMTGVNNIGILIVSKESDLSKETLSKLENINVIVPLTSNMTSVASLVKRFTPEALIIPNSIDGVDLSSKDILKLVKDVNVVEGEEKSLNFKADEFNSDDDVITNVYFI